MTGGEGLPLTGTSVMSLCEQLPGHEPGDKQAGDDSGDELPGDEPGDELPGVKQPGEGSSSLQ